ncbi:PH domain-containing protein [Alkalibacterium kapii]|uniref:YdbS-like PH domain-containing protein n=1 Tax=Alkalibacterium kapii TaxID=426704 RepID=A0A511AUC1_9LACT|nr:PH domain-containing protein [Alkalibacterium kapii]GEK90691.1 hypothetical protein AKA01nite_03130 [Alkalibacterium kapii]
MDYPLLENKLPETLKKVWRKTSFTTLLIALLLGVIITGIFFYFDALQGTWLIVSLSYFALAIVIYLLNFLLIDYRYNFFRYEVTSKEIIFQQGFIFRSITYVPFSRIQHIETEQGPFLRREQLMELIIHTSATDHSIAGLSIEEAQMIRQNVMRKVEETDEYEE